MTYVLSVLLLVGYMWLFWLLYVLVMGLYRAHLDNQLTLPAKILGFPVIILGFIVDWLANWTIASLLFWEFPKNGKELVTDRLTLYLMQEQGYKYKVAQWLCTKLLDYFDPRGKHCHG
jgi:hypothetical protein